MYHNSKNELNINDKGSKIYQLAAALYNSPDYNTRYKDTSNGIQLSFSDAFKLILAKRKSSPVKTSREKLLEKKITKANQKTSIGSPKGRKASKAPVENKVQNQKEVLDEYVNERKKTKAKKSIAGV